jgi:hypothetical protein
VWDSRAVEMRRWVHLICSATNTGRPQSSASTADRHPQNRKSLPREEVRQAFEKNRTAAGRRSAAIPSGDPGRRSGAPETRSFAGGGASLRWKYLYSEIGHFLGIIVQCRYACGARLKPLAAISWYRRKNARGRAGVCNIEMSTIALRVPWKRERPYGCQSGQCRDRSIRGCSCGQVR